MSPPETSGLAGTPSAASGTPEINLVIFDLDRTITRHGTYLPFLLYAASRLKPQRMLRLPAVVLAMVAYEARLFSRERLKERMQSLLLGSRIHGDTLQRLVSSYADMIARRGCRSEVVERLRAEQAAGHTVVIATAAQRYYAEAIGARLGVEHVIATESVWCEGDLMARLDGPNCRGHAKLDAIAAWLRQHTPLGAGAFRFYSDEFSDMPVFALAAERIAVHPGRRLRRIAMRRGWEVIG